MSIKAQQLLKSIHFPSSTCCRSQHNIWFRRQPCSLGRVLLVQVPLYALNQHLVFKTLEGLDMGGSITIHAFGAYYGLAASLVLSNGRQAPGAYTSANIKNSAT